MLLTLMAELENSNPDIAGAYVHNSDMELSVTVIEVTIPATVIGGTYILLSDMHPKYQSVWVNVTEVEVLLTSPRNSVAVVEKVSFDKFTANVMGYPP
jgi:hypothetical protein